MRIAIKYDDIDISSAGRVPCDADGAARTPWYGDC